MACEVRQINKPDKLVKGGHVVLPHGLAKMDILISQGRIQALVEPGVADTGAWAQADEIVDATRLVIFSGVIDTHVHFNTGTSHLDTIHDATRAAALGGTTTIVGHVRSTQGDIVGEIARQQELIKGCPIDVAFHGILTPQDDLVKIVPALIEKGVRSFKLFMTYQREGLGMDDRSLYMAFKEVAKWGGLPLVHAENPGIIAALQEELVAVGRTSITDYPASRPVHAEVEAIRRALWLAELANSPVYFVHVSSITGLELIAREKERRSVDLTLRPPVYAESCPKYLLLNDTAYQTLGGKAVVAPPLRSLEQQQALFQALLSGAIDTLGSDHSPHSVELKYGASFLAVQAGAPGAQTFFPVILSRVLEEQGAMGNLPGIRGAANGVKGRDDALYALQSVISLRPSKIFGLYPRKGWLGPGADADLVFVNPQRDWRVTRDWLISNSGFSLYEGKQLRGKAIHSMVRGRWVMRDGQLVCESGGQYLER